MYLYFRHWSIHRTFVIREHGFNFEPYSTVKPQRYPFLLNQYSYNIAWLTGASWGCEFAKPHNYLNQLIAQWPNKTYYCYVIGLVNYRSNPPETLFNIIKLCKLYFYWIAHAYLQLSTKWIYMYPCWWYKNKFLVLNSVCYSLKLQ